MYKELEQNITLHINKYEQAYTKPMYRQHKVKKQYGLSLNKFRKMLFQMHLDGKIKHNCGTGSTLPFWSKVGVGEQGVTKQIFLDKGGS